MLGNLSTNIGRVKHLLPDVSLSNQTGPVASPVASSPAGALVQELRAIFQSRLDLALPLVLDPSLPLVADQPASYKVVVIRVQNPLSPLLVLKPVKKVMAGEDLRPIGASASRHARGAAVNVVSSRNFKVASLNVSSAEPVPGMSRPRDVTLTSDSLVGANAANLGVFERS